MQLTTIGKAAHQSSVGVETIRFYERKGLIEQPGKPAGGGYRDYPPQTVERIRFIRQSQDLGFSLGEIKDLLSLRADPGADCRDVREQAEKKLHEVDQKLARLLKIQDAIKTLIAACPGEGALESCSILDAMAGQRT